MPALPSPITLSSHPWDTSFSDSLAKFNALDILEGGGTYFHLSPTNIEIMVNHSNSLTPYHPLIPMIYT